MLADGVKTVTDTGVQPINTPIIANDAAAKGEPKAASQQGDKEGDRRDGQCAAVAK